MSTWLRKLMATPAFEDEEKTRAAGLLNVILLSLLMISVVVVLIFAPIEPNSGRAIYDLMVSALAAVMYLGLLFLMRHGYVRTASMLLSCSLWVLTTVSVCTLKGIRNNAVCLYLVIVAIAALLLGGRAAVIFGLLSMLAVLGGYYAEIRGYVLFPMPASVEIFDWMMVWVALGIGTLLLRFAVNSITEGFERARCNAQALAESNYKLQTSRDALAQQAQELARSNVELEQFAYVVSHDLQEPLRMVKSYLQLLERDYKSRLDEDADEFIGYAVDGAARMQALIKDLLTYSRIGKEDESLDLTDCAEVLRVVLANLQMTIEKSGAVVIHSDLPTVMADKVQLIQLFQNLIGNAIKFRGDRPPEIHIGVERSNEEWTFSVRDNGIGIDPQQTERIFMIFQRLHTSEEYKGTGIGLAICKKIVERHGGRIWVESEPGKGSTFFFTIPDRGVVSSTLC
jgi:signal transduction histidine kinase